MNWASFAWGVAATLVVVVVVGVAGFLFAIARFGKDWP